MSRMLSSDSTVLLSAYFNKWKKNFSSSLCVQTGSEVHPASCTMGNGGPFPDGKARPGRDADHSPHLVPR
jgi:hypothetical protein